MLLGGVQARFIGLDVGEIEGIGAAQVAVDEDVAGFEEQVDALACADLEVVAALGADVDVGFELGFEEDGAAARALDPEAFGLDAGGLAVVRDWREGRFCAEILIAVRIAVGLAVVVGPRLGLGRLNQAIPV